MKISIIPVNQDHISSIVDILQSISNYIPEEQDYNQIWKSFKAQSNCHGLVAIDDTGAVIGYGSIVIEIKIRGGKMGHIEDIATKKEMRRKGVGKLILQSLYEIAKEENCYKISLACQKHNIPFYKKCGYDLTGIAMTKFT